MEYYFFFRIWTLRFILHVYPFHLPLLTRLFDLQERQVTSRSSNGKLMCCFDIFFFFAVRKGKSMAKKCIPEKQDDPPQKKFMARKSSDGSVKATFTSLRHKFVEPSHHLLHSQARILVLTRLVVVRKKYLSSYTPCHPLFFYQLINDCPSHQFVFN